MAIPRLSDANFTAADQRPLDLSPTLDEIEVCGEDRYPVSQPSSVAAEV
jgi:hypothetical protein